MGFQLPFPQLVSLPDFWTINSWRVPHISTSKVLEKPTLVTWEAKACATRALNLNETHHIQTSKEKHMAFCGGFKAER